LNVNTHLVCGIRRQRFQNYAMKQQQLQRARKAFPGSGSYIPNSFGAGNWRGVCFLAASAPTSFLDALVQPDATAGIGRRKRSAALAAPTRSHGSVPHHFYHHHHRRSVTSGAVLRPRIAIVGGGFGGLFTALKLAKLPWTRLTRPEITLVDRADRFSFLPMMYELATGEAEAWEVAPRFETLLQDYPISFVQASVESIAFAGDDAPTLHVQPCGPAATASTTPTTTAIAFDRAVLALGSQPAPRDRIPGAAEHALTLYSHDDALALKHRLNDIRKARPRSSSVNVVVVGGGFSGVEVAACLAETLGSAGSVIIVDRGDRLLARGEDFNRLAAERALSARGVSVEYGMSVASVSADSITLLPLHKTTGSATNDGSTPSDATTLPADLVVWTAGAVPSAAVASLGVPTDPVSGRIDTDELLQVRGREDLIFAVGDVASMPASDANGGYFGTAQVAMQQADYAAWNVWASLTGRRKLQYRYVQLGEMIVLGAREASVATKLGVDVDGAPGWAMRRAAYAARMPTERHRAKVAASWAVTPVIGGVVSSLASQGCVGTNTG
jgi:demethylphylloquinone reductase